ncbi:hypothetical protein G6F68_014735 [Rhizopus microsporus]|nr:hypothetical protein G6F68_014735 [Rhizopus microsporus]
MPPRAPARVAGFRSRLVQRRVAAHRRDRRLGHRRDPDRGPSRGREARPCVAATGLGVPAVGAGHGVAGGRDLGPASARHVAAESAGRPVRHRGRVAAGGRCDGSAVAPPPCVDRRRHLGRADRAADPGRLAVGRARAVRRTAAAVLG